MPENDAPTIADAWADYVATAPDQIPEDIKNNIRRVFYDGVLAALGLWQESKGDIAKWQKLSAEYQEFLDVGEKTCASV